MVLITAQIYKEIGENLQIFEVDFVKVEGGYYYNEGTNTTLKVSFQTSKKFSFILHQWWKKMTYYIIKNNKPYIKKV